MKRRTYIELFAGCGGLSLGLSSLGYDRMLANELSPMAAETYAYNLLGTDLSSAEFAKQSLQERKVLWLKSRHSASATRARLRENPLAEIEDAYCDLNSEMDLSGRLIVGDISALNRYVEDCGEPLVESPDIISGGPPCQSFSMAGLRQYDNRRNRLPWEFAKFVEHHKPKLVVLENVSGILHPFSENGRKIHAWFEVAKAFARVGYAPICLHVDAANVGVAQKRTRFLMFAVTENLAEAVSTSLSGDEDFLAMGRDLLRSRDQDIDFDPQRHHVVDLRNIDSLGHAPAALTRIFCSTPSPITVEQAIGDLSDQGGAPSEYVEALGNELSPALSSAADGAACCPHNHTHRRHSGRVRARFRVYQVLAGMGEDPETVRSVIASMRSTPDDEHIRWLSAADAGLLLRAATDWPSGLIDDTGKSVSDVRGVQELIHGLRSKKHSQRALRRDRPAPAALSIPDDTCHYSELRTLSVREMARIQSFPDDFIFRSIPTTGGARRAFQVPQYTQIGNAVPPRLGRAIGRFADYLLQFASLPDSHPSAP